MERHVATSATWPGVAAGHQLDWSRESSRRGLDLLPATPQSAARRANALTPDSTLPRSRSRVRLKLNLIRALPAGRRSEEHTSELQSRLHLVCRLLLEKKNY